MDGKIFVLFYFYFYVYLFSRVGRGNLVLRYSVTIKTGLHVE